MFCKNCQIAYNDAIKYCPNCGLETVKYEKCSKSKIGLIPKIFIIGTPILYVLTFIFLIFYLIFDITNYKIDEIDGEDFIKRMEKNDCEVLKNPDSFKISGARNYYATDDYCNYEVLFIEFNDKKEQHNFYDFLIDEVSKNPNIYLTNEFNFTNFHKYETTGKYYKNVIMSENTILYFNGLNEYKDEIDDIKHDLGYEYNVSLFCVLIFVISILILSFISMLIAVISNFKLFKKLGRNGFISLIPFYSNYCITKDVMGNGWWFLLSFIPGGNILYSVLFYLSLGEAFKKSISFKILLILLPGIFKPWLAFDDSKYVKPDKFII